MGVTAPGDSTGTITIFYRYGGGSQFPCSEVEYLKAMEALESRRVVAETINSFLGSKKFTELCAPHGMVTLSFNGGKNLLSVSHSDISRIYWESNI